MTIHRFASSFARSSVFNRGPLTEDELRARAPSIFASEAHASRSERYTYVPTIDVVRGLMKAGFQPFSARQGGTRDATRREFTKHLIRFRQPEMAVAVGDSIPEIILVNSHDGSSSYQIMAGMFRVRCLNGLVVQCGTMEDVRVPHKGNIIDNVIEGSFRVVRETERALAAPADWSGITLNADARQALAEAAHSIRFGEPEEGETVAASSPASVIRPAQLLAPRRSDDRASDLWTTFNVIQENTVKGGLTGMGRNAAGQRRRTTTREVKGIDQDVKLNKALWALSERMAHILKSAA